LLLELPPLSADVQHPLTPSRPPTASRSRPLLPFDWPAVSDPSGAAVRVDDFTTREGEGGWTVWRTPGTDPDGWLYGNVFPNLGKTRKGGRATRRAGDLVRSRLWRRPAERRQVGATGGGRNHTAARAAVHARLGCGGGGGCVPTCDA
jgi:hypothetical protein